VQGPLVGPGLLRKKGEPGALHLLADDHAREVPGLVGALDLDQIADARTAGFPFELEPRVGKESADDLRIERGDGRRGSRVDVELLARSPEPGKAVGVDRADPVKVGPDGSFLAGDEIRVSLVTGILEIFSAQAKVDQ
jgi:hypothetical protein